MVQGSYTGEGNNYIYTPGELTMQSVRGFLAGRTGPWDCQVTQNQEVNRQEEFAT